MTSFPAPAIRIISSFGKPSLIHLRLRVKSGASKQRAGVTSLSDDMINVCVSVQAREGEANKAVREVLSDVLKCPKSNVKLVQGFKSRDKTIAISGMDTNGDPQSVVSNIKKLLQNAIDS